MRSPAPQASLGQTSINIQSHGQSTALATYTAQTIMNNRPPEKWNVQDIDFDILEQVPTQFRATTLAQVVAVQMSESGLGLTKEGLEKFILTLNEEKVPGINHNSLFNLPVFNGVPLLTYLLQTMHWQAHSETPMENICAGEIEQQSNLRSLLNAVLLQSDPSQLKTVSTIEDAPAFLGLLAISIPNNEFKQLLGMADINQRLPDGRNLLDVALANPQCHHRLDVLLNRRTPPNFAHLSLANLKKIERILSDQAPTAKALPKVSALISERQIEVRSNKIAQAFEQLQCLFDKTNAFPSTNEGAEPGERNMPMFDRVHQMINVALSSAIDSSHTNSEGPTFEAIANTTMLPLIRDLLFHPDVDQVIPISKHYCIAKFLHENISTLEKLVPNLRQEIVPFHNQELSIHWIVNKFADDTLAARHVQDTHKWLHPEDAVDFEGDDNGLVARLIEDASEELASFKILDVYTTALTCMADEYRESIDIAALDLPEDEKNELEERTARIHELSQHLAAQASDRTEAMRETFNTLRHKLENSIHSGEKNLTWSRELTQEQQDQGIVQHWPIDQAVRELVDFCKANQMMPRSLLKDESLYRNTLQRTVPFIQGHPLTAKQQEVIQQRAMAIRVNEAFENVHQSVPESVPLAIEDQKGIEQDVTDEDTFYDAASTHSQGWDMEDCKSEDSHNIPEPLVNDNALQADEQPPQEGIDKALEQEVKETLDEAFKQNQHLLASHSPHKKSVAEAGPSTSSAQPTPPRPVRATWYANPHAITDARHFLPMRADIVTERHKPRLFNFVSLGGDQRSGESIRPQFMQGVFENGQLLHAIGFRPEQVGEKSLLSKSVHLAKRSAHMTRHLDLSWRPGKVVSFTPAPPSRLQDLPRGSNDIEYLEGSMASTMLGVEVKMDNNSWQGYFNAMNNMLPQNHTMDVEPFSRLGHIAHDRSMQSHAMTGHRISYTRDYEPTYKDVDFGRAVLNFSEGYGGEGERWVPHVERLINNQLKLAKRDLNTEQLEASLKKGFRDKATAYHHLLTLLKQADERHSLPFHQVRRQQRKELILESRYWTKLIEPSALECAGRRIQNRTLVVAQTVRDEHCKQLDQDLKQLSARLAFSGEDVMGLPEIKAQQMTLFQKSMQVELPGIPADIPSYLRKEVRDLQKALSTLADFNCGDLKQSITEATVNVNRLLQDELNEVYGRQKLAQALEKYGVSGAAAGGAVALITAAIAVEPIGIGVATSAGTGLMRLGDVWNKWRNNQSVSKAKENMIQQLQQNALPGALLPGYIQYSLHWLDPEQLLKKAYKQLSRLSSNPEIAQVLNTSLTPAMNQSYRAFKDVCTALLKNQVHLRLQDAKLEDTLTTLTKAQYEHSVAVQNAVLKTNQAFKHSNVSYNDYQEAKLAMKAILGDLKYGLDIPDALDARDKRLAGFEGERGSLLVLNTGQAYPRFKPRRLVNAKPSGLKYFFNTPARYKVELPFRKNKPLFQHIAKRLNFSVPGTATLQAQQPTRLWLDESSQSYQQQKERTRSLPTLAHHQLSPIESPHIALRQPDFIKQRMVISKHNQIPEQVKTQR